MSEPGSDVQARSALGAELAAYRRAAGYTQAELSELIGYSRSTVANVETGRQRVPGEFWRSADAVLRTGGVLSAGNDEVEAITRRDLRAIARQVSEARPARTWPQPPHGAPGAPAMSADGSPPQPRSASVCFWPPGGELPRPPGTDPGP
ncbi:MAG TPA: helix-turn-helix transcriptional regulator, partial [Streptosporangiaceae bacterium]